MSVAYSPGSVAVPHCADCVSWWNCRLFWPGAIALLLHPSVGGGSICTRLAELGDDGLAALDDHDVDGGRLVAE
jgi:hypothetical protein